MFVCLFVCCCCCCVRGGGVLGIVGSTGGGVVNGDVAGLMAVVFICDAEFDLILKLISAILMEALSLFLVVFVVFMVLIVMMVMSM